jgi:hypothetical protein
MSIAENDTVRVDNERGLWVVDYVHTPSPLAAIIGRKPYVSVSRTRRIGRDIRTTSRDVHPDRLTLVRKGNAVDDYVDALLADLDARRPLTR